MPKRNKTEVEQRNYSVLSTAASIAAEKGKSEASDRQVRFVAYLLDSTKINVQHVIPTTKSIFTSVFAGFLIKNLQVLETLRDKETKEAVRNDFFAELALYVKNEAKKAEKQGDVKEITKVLAEAAELCRKYCAGAGIKPASPKQVKFVASLLDEHGVDVDLVIPDRDNVILSLQGASVLIRDLKELGGKFSVSSHKYYTPQRLNRDPCETSSPKARPNDEVRREIVVREYVEILTKASKQSSAVSNRPATRKQIWRLANLLFEQNKTPDDYNLGGEHRNKLFSEKASQIINKILSESGGIDAGLLADEEAHEAMCREKGVGY